eukprot:GFKZ01000321.1.p1 GENE.GFKZ01000321.1~~GFKZ01000321.1.p1  ORF type:complete len:507 (+),score=40.47 GFKZ01000321.1:144-1664(+)
MGDESARLFIGNLPQYTSDESLLEAMALANCDISDTGVRINRYTGTGIDYAYVKFDCPETAEYAFRNLRSLEVHDQPALVDKASAHEHARLLVTNLAKSTTDISIRRACSSADCDVVEARIFYNCYDGYREAFCYLTFTSLLAAEDALVKLNGVEVDGRPIRVDRVRLDERARLFVGNLAPCTFHSSLLDAFRLADFDLIHVQLKIDRYTGRNHGFAFVTLCDPDTAENARLKMNGVIVDQRPIRVDKASLHQHGCLFVGNLSECTTDESLLEAFEHAECYLDHAKVSVDPDTGRNCGFGYVIACESGPNPRAMIMDGMPVDKQPIRVKYASLDERARLLVGNLAPCTTDVSLRRAFELAGGDIIDAVVSFEPDTGQSQEFGYVTFRSMKAAESAMGKMNGAEVDGRPIRVDKASSHEHGRLYVEDLAECTTDYSLRKAFEEANCEVIDALVFFDQRTGSRIGFGCVTFKSPEAAENALGKMNGVLVDGHPIYIGKELWHPDLYSE